MRTLNAGLQKSNDTTEGKLKIKLNPIRVRVFFTRNALLYENENYIVFSDTHKMANVSASSGIILNTTGAGTGSLNLQVDTRDLIT